MKVPIEDEQKESEFAKTDKEPKNSKKSCSCC